MRSKTKCINQPIVLPFVRLLWVACITLILSACSASSGGADSVSAGKNNSVNTGDMKIAGAVYFDQRTPDGFYKEPSQGDAYYVTSHVKNTDLLPPANRTGVDVYELTSDDFIEAMDWSEQAAVFQTSYKELVDNNETSLYHEFTRVDPGSPDFIYQHRVLKASVLDRNGVNEDYKGRITLTNMTSVDVKLIIEYLWTFTMNNNYGNAVLESYTTETDNEFVHVLQQAKLKMSFSESCDTIDVFETRYTVPKASGFIWKDEEVKRSISVKRTGDVLQLCEA